MSRPTEPPIGADAKTLTQFVKDSLAYDLDLVAAWHENQLTPAREHELRQLLNSNEEFRRTWAQVVFASEPKYSPSFHGPFGPLPPCSPTQRKAFWRFVEMEALAPRPRRKPNLR